MTVTLIKITSSQIHAYELSKPNRNPIIYLSVDFTPGLWAFMNLVMVLIEPVQNLKTIFNFFYFFSKPVQRMKPVQFLIANLHTT